MLIPVHSRGRRPPRLAQIVLRGVLVLLATVSAANASPPPPRCEPATGTAQRLRVGVAEDRPPLAYVAAFRVRGIVADYLPLLPEAGIELQPMPSAMLQQRLQQGQLDAVIGLSTRALPQGWLASAPLLRAPDVVVSQRRGRPLLGPEDLRGRVIATLDPLPAALRPYAPGAHVVADATTAMRLLERGNVELVLGNALLLDASRSTWQRHPAVVAGAPGTYDEAVFAVAPHCGAWLARFEQQQAALSASQRAAIVERWAAASKRLPLRGNGLWISVVSALVLVMGGLHLQGYRRLRREVRRRRRLQQRVDEITDNLPAVVFQAQWTPRDGLKFLFMAGDTPQLFSASPARVQASAGIVLAAIEPTQRWQLLRAVAVALRQRRPLQTQFDACGVRGRCRVAMQAWPCNPRHPSPTWSGYWIDVTDADAQTRATAQAHAHAQLDMHARSRLLRRLGEGIRGPMHDLLDQVMRLQPQRLDGEQRVARAALEDATYMLARILDDIQTLSQGDGPDVPLQPAPTDLRGVLQSVQQVLAPLAAAKGLRLTLQSAPDLASWLQADSTRLRQILFNLVGNAIKFTEDGGVLLRARVVADHDDAQVIELTVRDTGVGIAPERLLSVFEAFEQADVTISRRFGGTGLGLGICRRLVQAMGGQLDLHSVPAQGTTVVVVLTLPRVPPTRGAAAVPARDAHALSPAMRELPMATARVLVADDHPTHRLLLQWCLRDLGLPVMQAVDGTHALQLWRSTRPLLVLTDDQMPGSSGRDLLRAIREEELTRPGPRTGVIGMSVEPDALGMAGFDAVLGKPLQRHSLLQVIQRVCPGLLQRTVEPADVPQEPSMDDELPLAHMIRQFGSDAMARELLQSLRVSLEDDLQSLQRELAAGDATALAQRLHRIAGGIGSVGMGALAQWVRALCEDTHDLPAAARSALPRLQACLQRLQALQRAA